MRRREPLAVWLLFGVVGLEILVTYSRVPARELYHVSGSGLGGGASRVLVFLNFPLALVAIAIVAISFEGLRTRGLRIAAVAAVLLCLPVFWPGVVDQADLDARWVNLPAALGVALAVVASLAARTAPGARLRGDPLRIALAVLALLAAPAWIAAELGFYLDGVPVLGRIYQTSVHPAVEPGLPAVHHGHHHGMDGVLLVLAALLLSRLLPTIRARALRLASSAYLALMLVYGAGNIANDLWGEQFFKRGWTTWAFPSILEPRPTWAWAVVISAAAVILLAWFRAERAA